MSTNFDVNQLRANQRFVVQELLRRQVEVHVIDLESQLLEVRYQRRTEYLIDIDGSGMPFVSAALTRSKSITRQLLANAGLSVPRGERFLVGDISPALQFLSSTDLSGRAAVVKPAVGSQGDRVFTDIESSMELEMACLVIFAAEGEVECLIEEQCPGDEHRIFINQDGEWAAVKRTPPVIVGDGVSTIQEIADIETYRRMNPRVNCLCPIILDEEVDRFLKKQRMTTDTVLKKGQAVQIRGASNLMKGGWCEDVTDRVHPSFITVAKAALACFPNLPYAGLDIMTKDISLPAKPGGYWILEVNSLPGIGMHCAPATGKSQNVASMVVNTLFPETKSIEYSGELS